VGNSEINCFIFYLQTTIKDQAALAAFTFARGKEHKARKEVTNLPCGKECGEMDSWINGVWIFATRLVLPLANVLEQLSESLVGHGAG